MNDRQKSVITGWLIAGFMRNSKIEHSIAESVISDTCDDPEYHIRRWVNDSIVLNVIKKYVNAVDEIDKAFIERLLEEDDL